MNWIEKLIAKIIDDPIDHCDICEEEYLHRDLILDEYDLGMYRYICKTCEFKIKYYYDEYDDVQIG